MPGRDYDSLHARLAVRTCMNVGEAVQTWDRHRVAPMYGEVVVPFDGGVVDPAIRARLYSASRENDHSYE